MIPIATYEQQEIEDKELAPSQIKYQIHHEPLGSPQPENFHVQSGPVNIIYRFLPIRWEHQADGRATQVFIEAAFDSNWKIFQIEHTTWRHWKIKLEMIQDDPGMFPYNYRFFYNLLPGHLYAIPGNNRVTIAYHLDPKDKAPEIWTNVFRKIPSVRHGLHNLINPNVGGSAKGAHFEVALIETIG